MGYFLAFELDDQTKKHGRSPVSELLDAHLEGGGAVQGHAAWQDTGPKEEGKRLAAAFWTIFDHSYFSFHSRFLLLGLFFT